MTTRTVEHCQLKGCTEVASVKITPHKESEAPFYLCWLHNQSWSTALWQGFALDLDRSQ